MRLLNRIAIIFVVIMLIVGSFLSNCGHTELCHDDHCVFCQIIHMAKQIMDLFLLCLGFTAYVFLNSVLLSRINSNHEKFTLFSLVFQKVQFNE